MKDDDVDAALRAWGERQRAPVPRRLAEPGVTELRLVPAAADPPRRPRPVVAALLTAAAVVAAVGVGAVLLPHRDGARETAQPAPTEATPVRTADGGRSLVLAYGHGACDLPATLRADETDDTVTLELDVPSNGATQCTTQLITATIPVRLERPLGDRRLVYLGETVRPFDGSRLLEPTALPPAFTQRGESAGGPGPVWSRTWSPQRPEVTRACVPTDAPLGVSQGPADESWVNATDFRKTGTRDVQGATATVYTGTYFDGTPLGIVLVWKARGGSVALSSRPACGGDRIMTLDQLGAVADSLRPGDSTATAQEERTVSRLAVGSHCFGACAVSAPVFDLPDVTVYPDRSWIAATFDRTTGYPAFHRGSLSAEQYRHLQELARDARLPDDVSALELKPGVGIADGGATVFTGADTDGVPFSLQAAFLEEGTDRYSEDVPRRKALRAVEQALREVADGDGEPYEPERTALLARLVPQEVDAPTWTGTPLRDLPPSQRVRCGLLGDDALRRAKAQLLGPPLVGTVLSGGQRWDVRLRPLLPHERTCADLPLGEFAAP